jgi:hypothetical protein
MLLRAGFCVRDCPEASGENPFLGLFLPQKRLQRIARPEVFTEGRAQNIKIAIEIGSPFI